MATKQPNGVHTELSVLQSEASHVKIRENAEVRIYIKDFSCGILDGNGGGAVVDKSRAVIMNVVSTRTHDETELQHQNSRYSLATDVFVSLLHVLADLFPNTMLNLQQLLLPPLFVCLRQEAVAVIGVDVPEHGTAQMLDVERLE